MTDATALYVGMTRGRRSNTVHIVARTFDQACEKWVAASGRDRADLGVDQARGLATAEAANYAPEAPGESHRPTSGRCDGARPDRASFGDRLNRVNSQLQEPGTGRPAGGGRASSSSDFDAPGTGAYVSIHVDPAGDTSALPLLSMRPAPVRARLAGSRWRSPRRGSFRLTRGAGEGPQRCPRTPSQLWNRDGRPAVSVGQGRSGSVRVGRSVTGTTRDAHRAARCPGRPPAAATRSLALPGEAPTRRAWLRLPVTERPLHPFSCSMDGHGCPCQARRLRAGAA